MHKEMWSIESAKCYEPVRTVTCNAWSETTVVGIDIDVIAMERQKPTIAARLCKNVMWRSYINVRSKAGG